MSGSSSADGGRASSDRIGPAAFVRRAMGGTPGMVVFLATLVILGALWRIDFLLNDSVTVANVVTNVADGRLAVTEAPYALTAGEQPGLVEVDGVLYGRNYGQAYLAVPILWVLDATAGVVDLRLLLAAGWSFAVLGLGRSVGRLLDRPVVARIGEAACLFAFAASLLVATDVDWLTRPRPLVALGLSTLLLAATAATVCYRLVSWAQGRRVGFASGLALAVATPVGFWGSFPKRHVLSATALLLVVYWFAVSRTGSDRRAIAARAGAYAVVGFLASVHAFEAAFALAVLAPLDLLTAPTNDRRALGAVAVAFGVSLLPMVATNLAISGQPLQPPRTLPGADGPLAPGQAAIDQGAIGRPAGVVGDAGLPLGSGDIPGRPAGAGLLSPVAALLDRVVWVGTYMGDQFVAGVAAATDLDRLYHVLVRSGWIPSVRYHLSDYETLETAMLEVLPLAGALLALPGVALAHLREGARFERLRAGLADPVRQTDLFVGALAVTLFLAYLPRLPLYAMFTLRYVLPVMPLLLYAVARMPPVRSAAASAPRTLGGTWGVTVAVVGGGFVCTLAVLGLARGEVIQFLALSGLVTALALAAATATRPIHERDQVMATALGVAAGTTTVFVLATGLLVYADGNHALDLVRLVVARLPAVG